MQFMMSSAGGDEIKIPGTDLLEENVISINLIGKVEAKPDLIRLFLNVKSTKPTVQEALLECREKKAIIVDLLKKIKLTDIFFEGIRILEAQQNVSFSGEMVDIKLFTVVNNFVVNMEEIEKIKSANLQNKMSEVIAILTRAGCNLGPHTSHFQASGMGFIRYGFKDYKTLEMQAIENAVTEAKKTASDIAGRLNKKITDIHSVRVNKISQNEAYNILGMDLFGKGNDLFKHTSDTSGEVAVVIPVTVNFKLSDM